MGRGAKRRRNEGTSKGRAVRVAGIAVAGALAFGLSVAALTSAASHPFTEDEFAAASAEVSSNAERLRQAAEADWQERVDAAKIQAAFRQGAALRVAVVGDTVAGGGFPDTTSGTWAKRYADALRANGPVALTTSTATITAQNAGQLQMTPADVTIVSLGNDENYTDLSASEFREAYRAVLDRVRAVAPEGEIVCLSPWFSPTYMPAIHYAISQECSTHGGRFTSLGGLISRSTTAQEGDLWHGGLVPYGGRPNDLGNATISDYLARNTFVSAS